MTEQRHRTVLEYRVEDRQIRGLEQSVQRAFSEDTLTSFEKGLDRIARNIGALSSATDRFGQAADRRGGAPPSGGGVGGGRGSNADVLTALSGLSANIGRLAQDSRRRGVGPSGAGPMAASSYAGAAAGGLFSRMGGGGDGIIGQAFSTIPIVGGFLQAGVDAVQRYYAEFAAQQQQIAGSLGALGSRDLAGAGADYTRFGLDRGRAFSAAAGYAQSGGGALDELGARTALSLEHLGGIQDPTAIVGAANTGTRGGSSAGRVMLQAVSAGLVAGIRDARLGQYLSTMASALEQARTEGTSLSDESLGRMMQGFSALGSAWSGERATRATTSAASTMRAFSPGMDVASAVGLAAVGFGTPGGPSYHDALRMFQENPEQVMPQLLQQIRSMSGGDQGAGVELMRQIMPRFLGFTPTIDQARAAFSGDASAFSSEVDTQASLDFLRQRREGLMGGFGVAGAEAAYANRRAGIGGDVAGTALQIRGMEANLVSSTLPAIAGGISEILSLLQRSFAVILEQMRVAYSASSGGPTPIDLITNPGEVLGEFGREIRRIVDEATEGAPSVPRESLPVEDRGMRPGASPRASAADALRRISRDAGIAADAIDRSGNVPDGEVMVG